MCLRGSGQGNGGDRTRGGTLMVEGKRQRKGRRRSPNLGLVFSQWAVRPVPENRTSGHRTAASTTTGSCRGRQGFTGVKTVRTASIRRHPIVCIPMSAAYYGHVGPSSKSSTREMWDCIDDPRNHRARREFSPHIAAPRKCLVSFPIFGSIHARGSAKYPCDPIQKSVGFYWLYVEHRYRYAFEKLAAIFVIRLCISSDSHSH